MGLRWVFNGFVSDVVNGFHVIFLVVLCMILWMVFLMGLWAGLGWFLSGFMVNSYVGLQVVL